MLTKAIANAFLDDMPLPILADLYEDETGESGEDIRKGKVPFSRAQCEAILYCEECARLMSLSHVNLAKTVKSSKYKQGFINYLLYHTQRDFIRTRAIRAAFYGDPVFFKGEKVTRANYQPLLKLAEALGRKDEKRALQWAFWNGRVTAMSSNRGDH